MDPGGPKTLWLTLPYDLFPLNVWYMRSGGVSTQFNSDQIIHNAFSMEARDQASLFYPAITIQKFLITEFWLRFRVDPRTLNWRCLSTQTNQAKGKGKEIPAGRIPFAVSPMAQLETLRRQQKLPRNPLRALLSLNFVHPDSDTKEKFNLTVPLFGWQNLNEILAGIFWPVCSVENSLCLF